MKEHDVLFICRSNVARSQMGEAFYNHLVGGGAISAGTAAGDFPNVTTDILQVMKEVGIEMPYAFPKKLTQEMAASVGKIILITNYAVPGYLKDNDKVTYWDVPDPRGVGLDGIRIARDQIRSGVIGILPERRR